MISVITAYIFIHFFIYYSMKNICIWCYFHIEVHVVAIWIIWLVSELFILHNKGHIFKQPIGMGGYEMCAVSSTAMCRHCFVISGAFVWPASCCHPCLTLRVCVCVCVCVCILAYNMTCNRFHFAVCEALFALYTSRWDLWVGLSKCLRCVNP